MVGPAPAREPTASDAEAEQGAEEGTAEDPDEAFAFGVDPVVEGFGVRGGGGREGGVGGGGVVTVAVAVAGRGGWTGGWGRGVDGVAAGGFVQLGGVGGGAVASY